jgi:predicted alpha/beta-hydrolase family hydrolase
MAICLADSSSLGSSDACQLCLQLHQKVQSSRSNADGAEPLDGFATLPAADAGAQGAAGPKAGTGLAVDVAGKQRLLRGLAAAAAAVVHQWSGSAGGKQPKEARKQLRSMLGDARQQLKAQLKAAKGKSAGKALGSNVAAGVAVYVRSQIDVLASWSASLSAGSSTGSKRSDPVEQLQQRQKKQKS